jgi:hypothetical protein
VSRRVLQVLLVTLSLWNCDDGIGPTDKITSIRLLGTVTWVDCRPVPDVSVVVYTIKCVSFSRCDETIHASGSTDQEGKFDFVVSSNCYSQGSPGRIQARADTGAVRLSLAWRVECREVQEFALVMGSAICTP